jgi:hypothetical protein
MYLYSTKHGLPPSPPEEYFAAGPDEVKASNGRGGSKSNGKAEQASPLGDKSPCFQFI